MRKTGAQSVPVAMPLKNGKRPLKLMVRDDKHYFRALRSLQAWTLALQSEINE
jgi:hypothetical protein